MPRKSYLPILAGALVALILIICLALRLGGAEEPEVIQDNTAPGVQYIKQLEGQNPDTVDQRLKYLRQQEILQMCEERLAQLESGELSVWTLFDDYVLLGDSRAVGFYFYEFLPESRVLAEGGATIRHLKEHIPDIVKLNPANIFLCYGLNDVGIGIWPTPEDYTAEFSETVAEIHRQLPEAKIFISSILPARDPAFAQSSAWYDIPEYSAAVAEMCGETSYCYYVDNDEIAEEYADLWEIDGIHVMAPFYSHWATNLIMSLYSSELEDSGLDAPGSSGDMEPESENSDAQ